MRTSEYHEEHRGGGASDAPVFVGGLFASPLASAFLKNDKEEARLGFHFFRATRVLNAVLRSDLDQVGNGDVQGAARNGSSLAQDGTASPAARRLSGWRVGGVSDDGRGDLIDARNLTYIQIGSSRVDG